MFKWKCLCVSVEIIISGIMLAKIDKKGRITIPKEFREKLGRVVKISMVGKRLLIESVENPLNRIRSKVKLKKWKTIIIFLFVNKIKYATFI